MYSVGRYLLALSTLLFAAPCSAQYMSMFNASNQAAVNFAGTVGVNAAIGQSAKFAKKKRSARTKKKLAQKIERGAAWLEKSKRSARYRPIAYSDDSGIRAQVIATYVDIARKVDPTGGEELAQVFRERDLFGEFAGNARAFGLDTRDFGDVMAAYWSVCWGAVHKIGRPSRTQVQGMRKQIRSALAGTRFKQLTTPAARQKMADDMMVKLILVDGAVQQSLRRGRGNDLRRMSKAVRQSILNSMGVDLSALDLTASGLRSR